MPIDLEIIDPEKWKCVFCIFWIRGTDYSGDCRKRSPMCNGKGKPIWPITGEHMKCGDYHPKNGF